MPVVETWPRRLVVKDAWFSAMRSRVRIPSGLPKVKRKTFSVEVFRFLLLRDRFGASTRESEHKLAVSVDMGTAKS